MWPGAVNAVSMSACQSSSRRSGERSGFITATCRMPCLKSSIANLAAASSGLAAVATFDLLEAIHSSSNEVRTLPGGNLRSKEPRS